MASQRDPEVYTVNEGFYVVAKIPKLTYDESVKKILLAGFIILIFFLLNLLIYPLFTSTVYAAVTFKTDPDPVCQDKGKYILTFDGAFETKEDYSYAIWKPNADFSEYRTSLDWKKPTNAQTYKSNDITIVGERAEIGRWHYKLWLGKGFDILQKEPSRLISSGDYVLYPKEACELGLPVIEMLSPVKINSQVSIKVRNINPDSDYLLWFLDGQVFNDGKFPDNPDSTIINDSFIDKTGVEKSIKTASLSVQLDNQPGNKTLCFKHGKTNFFGFGKDNCEFSSIIAVTVQEPQVTPTLIQSSQPGAPLTESTLFEPTPTSPSPPCAKGKFIDGKCLAVNTAVGEISTEPQKFVQGIFSIVLGIAGGIALILIIISGYRFMASQGNPEALTNARSQLIAAIVGLLFIIFSFVILQVIGVDILKIPGFTQ